MICDICGNDENVISPMCCNEKNNICRNCIENVDKCPFCRCSKTATIDLNRDYNYVRRQILQDHCNTYPVLKYYINDGTYDNLIITVRYYYSIECGIRLSIYIEAKAPIDDRVFVRLHPKSVAEGLAFAKFIDKGVLLIKN